MYLNQYQEHLAHSWPCNSRFDGFCRGDVGNDEPDTGSRVIGRMTSAGGYRVTLTEFWSEFDSCFEVHVNAKSVHFTHDHAEALAVARWYMDRCPA